MNVLNPLRAPFGKGTVSRLKGVSYHPWKDVSAVEFDGGVCFLNPHHTIRKGSKILAETVVESIALDQELPHGFLGHCDTGEPAEVSWAFIRELPTSKRGAWEECCRQG